MHDQRPDAWVSYAIAGVVVLLVLAFRMRNIGRMRPLKLERLWIVPALYSVLAIAMFVQHPPGPWGWLFCALALVIGAALGWQRGRLMEIHVDPESHALNQRQSPAALIFIIVLIMVRQGARAMIGGGAGAGLHLSAMLITDLLIALALGLFAAQRLEMYLRARRLLDAARAGRGG